MSLAGVFLDTDTVRPADLDLDALTATLPDWALHPASAPGEIGERLRGRAVVVTNKAPLDAAALAGAPDLRLVCVAATGTNNVDLDAAAARGVVVCNARGYATPSVVEHVFMLMLALRRRLLEHHRAVTAGAWSRATGFCLLDFPFRELAGATLGIVGYGELGRAVARAAGAFGMEVLVAARPGTAPAPDRVALPELLARADVVSLHCPLTPETRNLIGPGELARMRPDALLINTARGGIVDEAALAEALRAGALGGAGVDVLTQEPPRGANPLLAPHVPNLIVTPHAAWAARESRQRLLDEVTRNIRAYLAGEPRNRVA